MYDFLFGNKKKCNKYQKNEVSGELCEALCTQFSYRNCSAALNMYSLEVSLFQKFKPNHLNTFTLFIN